MYLTEPDVTTVWASHRPPPDSTPPIRDRWINDKVRRVIEEIGLPWQRHLLREGTSRHGHVPSKLTEAQHQASHTIAIMKAAEEDLRREVPPPYWYSNPATLDLAIPNQAQRAGDAPLPRRPATARSESRSLRKGGRVAPASPASPQ